MPGTFVLREADEAMEIRTYAQEHRSQRAVIAGGGLLGLEAAYALHKLGLQVTILERGPWLLRRQLDQCSGHLLRQHLEQLGMRVLLQAETTMLDGRRRLHKLALRDGRVLHCDIFLMAAGIRPNTELAVAMDLTVNRGVVVNEQMETSEPGVYAVGDLSEFAGEVPGLWNVAAEQARVAAINAVGGDATYKSLVPATTLKVVGVDVTSIGRFRAAPGEGEIVLEDEDNGRYRKLVIANGKIVGAILLGHAKEATAVTTAIKQAWDVSDLMPALLMGQWGELRHRFTKSASG
jgi:NAD(P)H-nitrite reductase large subunit